MDDFSLTSLSVTGPLSNQEGVQYKAIFSVLWKNQEFEFKAFVQTNEGWGAAQTLACEEMKLFAEWLSQSAEHQKTGPHGNEFFGRG